jgi:hypothetical protein
MDQENLRGSLLTTSSVFALLVGLGGTAAAQCAHNNVAGAIVIPAATTQNCVSYNNGTAITGSVTNNGTLTGVVPYPPLNPGTSTGISVVKSNTVLNGNIVNNGTISAQNAGINVGEGATGAPRPTSTSARRSTVRSPTPARSPIPPAPAFT